MPKTGKFVKPKKKVVVSGANFGNLTVVGKTNTKLVLCICNCGNETLVNPEYLLNGMVQDCDSVVDIFGFRIT